MMQDEACGAAARAAGAASCSPRGAGRRRARAAPGAKRPCLLSAESADSDTERERECESQSGSGSDCRSASGNESAGESEGLAKCEVRPRACLRSSVSSGALFRSLSREALGSPRASMRGSRSSGALFRSWFSSREASAAASASTSPALCWERRDSDECKAASDDESGSGSGISLGLELELGGVACAASSSAPAANSCAAAAVPSRAGGVARLCALPGDVLLTVLLLCCDCPWQVAQLMLVNRRVRALLRRGTGRSAAWRLVLRARLSAQALPRSFDRAHSHVVLLEDRKSGPLAARERQVALAEGGWAAAARYLEQARCPVAQPQRGGGGGGGRRSSSSGGTNSNADTTSTSGSGHAHGGQRGDPISFHGFYTDGGLDVSVSGTETRRRHWAGNAFRPESKSFYCSEARANVLLCAALGPSASPAGGVGVGGDGDGDGVGAGGAPRSSSPLPLPLPVEAEARQERREMLRRRALLGCLRGSYYDISSRPQVLNRASTAELERMFVDIVDNAAGLELLVSAKFGWCGLSFFLGGRRAAARDAFRAGLRSLAAKVTRERAAREASDRAAIALGRRVGCQLVFAGAHALDADCSVVVRPGILTGAPEPPGCPGGFEPAEPAEVAVVQRLVVEREGNFTCPVNCGALYTSIEVLAPETLAAARRARAAGHLAQRDEAAAAAAPDPGPAARAAVIAAGQLAQCAAADVLALKRNQLLTLLDDVTSVEQIGALVAAGRLPPVARHQLRSAVQIVEFAPGGQLQSPALQLVAWFRVRDRALQSCVDIPLLHPRTGRYLLAKLISAEDRMALVGLNQDNPNIDISGVFAFGQVLRVTGGARGARHAHGPADALDEASDGDEEYASDVVDAEETEAAAEAYSTPSRPSCTLPSCPGTRRRGQR
jgi:hypothetical protein